jgi:hypothetical protein
VLLTQHPAEAPGAFADILKGEAAHRLQSAVVHGGTIALLAAQMVGFALLAARLGAARGPVIAALALSAMGFASLAGSLTLDGLVIPDIATRYAAAPPEAMAGAKALFVLAGSLIRFLMPMGLAFQAAGAACWGVALWRAARPDRMAGGLGLAVGALVLAGLAATITGLDGMLVMGAFAGQAVWQIALGVGLIRAR